MIQDGDTKNLPAWADIPEDFKRDRGDARPWVKLFEQIFYSGGAGIEFQPKPGVDTKEALRRIVPCMRSWDPKHEHKTAGCALMFSQSFDGWSLDGVPQVEDGPGRIPGGQDAG